MPSSHLILCRPILLLPPIPPSIRVFSDESILCIRWPKCWSFSFRVSPFNEHPGLISFRMDWLDLLAVQGTPKSLLQHHSSKASIPQHSAFFTVQLSHPYMTTGKTIALTRQTFVGKVIVLLFNMLTYMQRNKSLGRSYFWLGSLFVLLLGTNPIASSVAVNTESNSRIVTLLKFLGSSLDMIHYCFLKGTISVTQRKCRKLNVCVAAQE